MLDPNSPEGLYERGMAMTPGGIRAWIALRGWVSQGATVAPDGGADAYELFALGEPATGHLALPVAPSSDADREAQARGVAAVAMASGETFAQALSEIAGVAS